MSEPRIPPPDAKPYLEARIGSLNYTGKGLRCLWYSNRVNEDAQAVLEELHRRCHAAEAELARLRIAVDAAVMAERERCAKIADSHDYGYLGNDYSNGRNRAARAIAAAIRGDAS